MLNVDAVGARSGELEGSAPSLLRALSGTGGTLYRSINIQHKIMANAGGTTSTTDREVAGSNPVPAPMAG